MTLKVFISGHWQLIAMTAIVFALWQYSIVIPLKIFVVFLHEFSHALATWLTGGKVLELSVSAQQGGFVTSQGGNGFIIASSGYLGSLLLGSFLFILALRSKLDRYVIGLLGATMIILTALYIREPFAIGYCLGAGASDARILAQNYGGSTMMWGIIWLGLSLGILLFCLKVSLKRPSNIKFKAAIKKPSLK